MSVIETHTYQDENGKECELSARLVIKVTERETDKKGQRLPGDSLPPAGGSSFGSADMWNYMLQPSAESITGWPMGNCAQDE